MDDPRTRPSRLYVEPGYALPDAPCFGAQRLPQITKRTVGANDSPPLSRDSARSGGPQAGANQSPRTCRRVDRRTLNTGYSECTLSSRRSHVLRAPALYIPKTIALPVGKLSRLV